MTKNIRLIWLTLLIVSLCTFGLFAEEEETTSAVTVSASDEAAVEIETEDGVAETTAADEPAAKETKKTKEEKAAEKSEKEQKKQEKIDRYQAKLFKRLEMSVDGYSAAAAIPVIDMYRDRMIGSGVACVVTGSLMAICCPVMMGLGGAFGFSDEYGGKCWDKSGGTIDLSKKENIDIWNQYIPYFIAGTVVFSMGAAFGVMSLIITPMCAIYFSKAHKSKLVLKRLKGLAMLQGVGINYFNDGEHDKLGLSMGFKI